MSTPYTSINPAEITEIELELTTHCNFGCALCFRYQSKERSRHANLQTIIGQLDSMPNLKDVTIAGQNGEPTLYPDLFKVIKYLNSRGIGITLYTNAEAQSLAYYALLAKILGKQGSMRFGVFGATPEIHAHYRKGSDLAKVLAVHDACAKYCSTELWWILFKYNMDDFVENTRAFGNRKVVVYNTLPFREFFQYRCNADICFPRNLEIDKLTMELPAVCPNDVNRQCTVDVDGNLWHCFLERYFGPKYCYLCNQHNINHLRSKGCMGLNEFGG